MLTYKLEAHGNYDLDGIVDYKVTIYDAGSVVATTQFYVFTFDEADTDAFDLLDSVSGETAQLSELLDETSFGRKLHSDIDINDTAKEYWEDVPILVSIDRIEVLPSARGNFLARKIIRQIIEPLSMGGLIALVADPLQLNGMGELKGMELDRLEQDNKKAQKSLINYYKKIGFKQFHNDNLLYLPY